jgi:hypothetical protein
MRLDVFRYGLAAASSEQPSVFISAISNRALHFDRNIREASQMSAAKVG